MLLKNIAWIIEMFYVLVTCGIFKLTCNEQYRVVSDILSDFDGDSYYKRLQLYYDINELREENPGCGIQLGIVPGILGMRAIGLEINNKRYTVSVCACCYSLGKISDCKN